MSTWYKPEKVSVCARLAGDHQAGLMLFVIMQRYRYAKATLKSVGGTWSANRRTVWFEAASLSRNQGDRALARLEQRGLIERAHGSWGGKPNVLYIRPTDYAQRVCHAATTFLALDALLGGGKSDALETKALRRLWHAWPSASPEDDPKKAGAIAVWYEQLGPRTTLTKSMSKKSMDLKPHALDLLKQILTEDPELANAAAEDLERVLEEAVLNLASGSSTYKPVTHGKASGSSWQA